MASQPPQQPQRRGPPPQSREEAFDDTRRADSQAPSTTSIDSQTLILNSSSSNSYSASHDDSATTQTSKTDTPQVDSSTLAATAQDRGEPRRCWICLSEETDDTPQSSVWRSPCPCVLTAHESCLLDWVTDIESADTLHSTAQPPQLRCPQCKAQIYLTRPRSNLLDAVATLDKYSSNLLLPAIAAGTVYSFALALSHHGAHTIRTIFDEHDAESILATRTWAEMNWLEREALVRFPTLFKPFFRDWRGLRVELGLPLIPVTILVSRTSFADGLLTFLPVFFFASHPPSASTLDFEQWPPSPAMTFVVLPYLRSAYSRCMEHFWGKLERGWLKEVQQRIGADDDESTQQQDNGQDHDHDNDFEVDFEVELNLGHVEENEDNDDDDDDDFDGAAPGPNIPIREHRDHDWQAEVPPEDLADAVEMVEAAQEREEAAAGGRRDGVVNQRIDLVSLFETVSETLFGALFFPLISEGSGELLRLLLPLSWTVAPRRKGWGKLIPTGLLQTKWGRSVVGGCLFVILKDAVRIYCRWRIAVSFRNRRVRDYDKKLGKVV